MDQLAELRIAGSRAPAQPRLSLRRFSRPSLIVGLAIVAAFFVVALAAPLLAPSQGGVPGALVRDGVGLLPEAPSPGHPLGLMAGGYDIYRGLIWGARAALRLALLVTTGRAVLGILLGLLAGACGGLADAGLMRLTDAFLAFPLVAALMVALVTVPLSEGLLVLLVFVAFGWMPYARLIRGNLLVEREKEYVQAARAAGVRTQRLLTRHLLPNGTRGLFVLMASDMGAVVLLAAAFSFIDLLGRAPELAMMANWGTMLSAARDWIIGTPDKAFYFWYTYLPVSAAIILFSIGWNLVGDGLRDAFDPRLR